MNLLTYWNKVDFTFVHYVGLKISSFPLHSAQSVHPNTFIGISDFIVCHCIACICRRKQLHAGVWHFVIFCFAACWFVGILGSLFSFLQYLTSPLIGAVSDVYGRKPLMVLTSVSFLVKLDDVDRSKERKETFWRPDTQKLSIGCNGLRRISGMYLDCLRRLESQRHTPSGRCRRTLRSSLSHALSVASAKVTSASVQLSSATSRRPNGERREWWDGMFILK